MKYLITLIFSILIIFSAYDLNAQKFISKRQHYITNDSEGEYKDKPRVILITGNKFEIELPNDIILKGTLTLISDETKAGKIINSFKTDKECILVVNEDNIFLNLFKTDGIAYTFYLDNYIEPTEEEKQKTNEEIEYKLNVELYGKFTADCIKEGKVKPGMDGVAVLLILGTPEVINQTETENIISEQLVYDDMYVYLENGKVTAIQRRMEIK